MAALLKKIYPDGKLSEAVASATKSMQNRTPVSRLAVHPPDLLHIVTPPLSSSPNDGDQVADNPFSQPTADAEAPTPPSYTSMVRMSFGKVIQENHGVSWNLELHRTNDPGLRTIPVKNHPYLRSLYHT